MIRTSFISTAVVWPALASTSCQERTSTSAPASSSDQSALSPAAATAHATPLQPSSGPVGRTAVTTTAITADALASRALGIDASRGASCMSAFEGWNNDVSCGRVGGLAGVLD